MFAGHIIAAIVAAVGLLYWVFTKIQSLAWPVVHIVMMLTIVLGLVIFLFRQKKKISATVFFFAGYCAIVMTAFIYFVGPLNLNNPSRSFSSEISRTVPPDKELIAYNSISARTIHYTGRNIAEIHDIAGVRNRYEKGVWIIATGDNYKDIIKEGGFEIVFYRQIAERDGSKDAEGALFHKSSGK